MAFTVDKWSYKIINERISSSLEVVPTVENIRPIRGWERKEEKNSISFARLGRK